MSQHQEKQLPAHLQEREEIKAKLRRLLDVLDSLPDEYEVASAVACSYDENPQMQIRPPGISKMFAGQTVELYANGRSAKAVKNGVMFYGTVKTTVVPDGEATLPGWITP